MLAAVIIFGYLGYYCKKYDLDINNLEISGQGLVFITIPACLSTMFWPTFFIFGFFCTLILIGIDSQFGLVEGISYYIEDLKPTFQGKVLEPETVKAIICTAAFILGLPLSTRGGAYVMNLLDTFGFAVPCGLSLFLTVVVWGSLLMTFSSKVN